MKESRDNARVWINSVLIVFMPCFNIKICSHDLPFVILWKDYLKTWNNWNSQMGSYSTPLNHSCKDQRADARWVMNYVHKTQSFMKTEDIKVLFVWSKKRSYFNELNDYSRVPNKSRGWNNRGVGNCNNY